MKQRCFDPRDPDYDGPDDDIEPDLDEDDYTDPDYDFYADDPADDFIMTEPELRGIL